MAKTLFALAGLYFLFAIVVEQYISRNIKNRRTRYGLRKVLTAMYVLIFMGALFAIWVQNPQIVVVSIGLVGAAITFILQDLLKNLVGGFAIFASHIYSVGDRVQILDKRGDVVDIGLLYTTLMEIREWIDGDQSTGRLTTIPNGFAFTNIVDNYTKDFPYVWDEISFPIAIDSDLDYTTRRFRKVAETETSDAYREAEEALTEVVMEKYYLNKREVRPTVYVTFNEDWAVIYVRYITRVGERRLKRSRIYQLCLEEIQRSEDIRLGSTI